MRIMAIVMMSADYYFEWWVGSGECPGEVNGAGLTGPQVELGPLEPHYRQSTSGAVATVLPNGRPMVIRRSRTKDPFDAYL